MNVIVEIGVSAYLKTHLGPQSISSSQTVQSLWLDPQGDVSSSSITMMKFQIQTFLWMLDQVPTDFSKWVQDPTGPQNSFSDDDEAESSYCCNHKQLSVTSATLSLKT